MLIPTGRDKKYEKDINSNRDNRLGWCKPSADKTIELAKKEIAADTRDPDSSSLDT